MTFNLRTKSHWMDLMDMWCIAQSVLPATQAYTWYQNNINCPSNSASFSWTLEYTGFLMAARDYISIDDLDQSPVFDNTAGDEFPQPHFRTEYICVNMNPVNSAVGASPDPTEALLAHTRAICNGLPGLRDIVCIPFLLDQEPPTACDAENTYCNLGPLGCSVCTIDMNT